MDIKVEIVVQMRRKQGEMAKREGVAQIKARGPVGMKKAYVGENNQT